MLKRKRVSVLIIALFSIILSVVISIASITSIYTSIIYAEEQERIYGSSALKLLEIAEAELGAPNGNKYRAWWNGGYADGAPWCATFVSWCAAQCGMLGDIIPRFQSCTLGTYWFKDHGLWAEGNSYIPRPGDIIFFDWDKYDPGPEHVGIVWTVENSVIRTIEGNSGDRCESNSYYVHSSYIYGYGLPKYTDITYDNGINLSENEIYYLAKIVYAEAGASWLTDHHQQMVASVVINRIKSKLYPNTLMGVISQPGQYQPYIDGSVNYMVPDERTIRNTRFVVKNGPICPSNVLTQSGYSYAYDGIYEIIYDPLGILMPTYFCIINE